MNPTLPESLPDSSREFKTELALSIAAGGIAVEGATDFDSTHEILEFVLGHPVWTHELAQRGLWAAAAQIVKSQHPLLKFYGSALRDDPSQHAEVRRLAIKEIGPTVQLKFGTNVRNESPVDSALRMFGEDKVVVI